MSKKKQTKKEKRVSLMHISLKGVNKETNSITAVFSTADEDRHGDVVAQNWELKSFRDNPVIINSHNYYDATEVIGKATRVEMVDGKLEGDIEFAVAENPKAKTIYDLYVGGFLNAFSVGFIPLEFDKDYNPLRSELLEVSAVSVPANAMALAKGMGIDIDTLDDADIGRYSKEIEEKFTEGKPKDKDDEEPEEEGTEEIEEVVDEDDEPTETPEEVIEEEKPKKSVTQRYAEATRSMRQKRAHSLNMVLRAINNLENESKDASKGERKADARKIHKAVRKLAGN